MSECDTLRPDDDRYGHLFSHPTPIRRACHRHCGCAKPDFVNDLVILPHDITFMDTVVERLVYNVCRIQKGKWGYPTKYEPESDRQ